MADDASTDIGLKEGATRASTDVGTVLDRPPVAARIAPPPLEPEVDDDDDQVVLTEVKGSNAPIIRGSEAGKMDSAATSVGSPVEALHRAEILRTRMFCRVTIGIAVAGLIGVPLLP